ncbi:TetR/AcrR family transcriptional regulator [Actinacidiphila yeochonensis]|uniref:TetR/AcrR family transcriptional regulator n=1 Tax=Actinacidiphila yeochonensis TaxID=89050 RepID=UPI00068925EC|nr:helix-turn-helix domain-containing protein [Actinacidiphila yeochonensis]
MHIHDSQRASASASDGQPVSRPAPLRVDAQRNLEHVLRAAREVFGELGYGAPMEDVARRARVGVGTVYRRFPSKDVLVRRIAQEETARLTDQARTALGQEEEAWAALARFLRSSAASGAGRLLPPQVLRVDQDPGGGPDRSQVGRPDVPSDRDSEAARVPGQRVPDALAGTVAGGAPGGSGNGSGTRDAVAAAAHPADAFADPAGRAHTEHQHDDDGGVGTLLDVVGQLVERARTAGELRLDVSVADVLLVIAAAAPALPDAAQHAAASGRLLDILLDGLRSRPAEPLAGPGAASLEAGPVG